MAAPDNGFLSGECRGVVYCLRRASSRRGVFLHCGGKLQYGLPLVSVFELLCYKSKLIIYISCPITPYFFDKLKSLFYMALPLFKISYLCLILATFQQLYTRPYRYNYFMILIYDITTYSVPTIFNASYKTKTN